MQREWAMPDMYFYKAVESSGSEKEIFGFAKWTVEDGDLVTDKDSDQKITQQDGPRDSSNSPTRPPKVPEEDSNEVFFD
ncbi:MAG: hypothetical protein Q9211_001728 [Gyalolechia sp. 1 TL-2023]